MRARLDHLDERAELYALGLLENNEHERIDAHVRTCLACAQRLGRAEAAVAALADATQPVEAAPASLRARVPTASPRAQRPRTSRGLLRSPATWAGAAAAAFAIATGSLFAQNAALQSTVISDGVVYSAMVHSHFNHAQFVTPDGTPIEAKVVYERHGAWYEIFATGIDPNTRIAVVRDGIVTPIQAPFAMRGVALTVTLPALGAVDDVRLLDAQGRLLAHVRPVLSADPR